jgi:hypothetical protein
MTKFICPHCHNDDDSLIEVLSSDTRILLCVVCSKKFTVDQSLIEVERGQNQDSIKNLGTRTRH